MSDIKSLKSLIEDKVKYPAIVVKVADHPIFKDIYENKQERLLSNISNGTLIALPQEVLFRYPDLDVVKSIDNETDIDDIVEGKIEDEMRYASIYTQYDDIKIDNKRTNYVSFNISNEMTLHVGSDNRDKLVAYLKKVNEPVRIGQGEYWNLKYAFNPKYEDRDLISYRYPLISTNPSTPCVVKRINSHELEIRYGKKYLDESLSRKKVFKSVKAKSRKERGILNTDDIRKLSEDVSGSIAKALHSNSYWIRKGMSGHQTKLSSTDTATDFLNMFRCVNWNKAIKSTYVDRRTVNYAYATIKEFQSYNIKAYAIKMKKDDNLRKLLLEMNKSLHSIKVPRGIKHANIQS